MFGILKAVLTVAPAVIAVARKAPEVVGLVADTLGGARRARGRRGNLGGDSDFAENALSVVAYAAAQFKTAERARQCGVAHGKRITEKMNRRVPGWELAEDRGLIPYLEGLRSGLKSDG